MTRAVPKSGAVLCTHQCSAGYFYNATTIDCEQCPAGRFSSAGALNCTLCPAGSASGAPGTMDACPVCTAGEACTCLTFVDMDVRLMAYTENPNNNNSPCDVYLHTNSCRPTLMMSFVLSSGTPHCFLLEDRVSLSAGKHCRKSSFRSVL